MLNFAFSPEIKHKQRPFERCFFPLVYLVLQNNHAHHTQYALKCRLCLYHNCCFVYL